MRVNTNFWNKARYTFYTPIYDGIARYFSVSRKRSIDALNITKGSKILILGAGTGLDLEFLPTHCYITAIDITPSMIFKVKQRSKKLHLNVDAYVMDGQQLTFEDETFDYIILHLILAVIPSAEKCISEAERVLKSNGKVAIFDKFLGDNRSVSTLRRLLNYITNFLFSDITRSFKTINSITKLEVVSDEKADFKGLFRLIQVRKNG